MDHQDQTSHFAVIFPLTHETVFLYTLSTKKEVLIKKQNQIFNSNPIYHFDVILNSKAGVGQNNKTKEESMRKVATLIVVVAAALMLNMTFAQASFAQASQSAGPVSRGAWTLGVPGLDTATTFTGMEAIVVEPGKVIKVEKMAGVKDGLQMRFVTDQGNAYIVYMGPKWFIENQKIKFMAGDKVEVRGKKYGSAIIATEISKGDWTMKLRNEEDGVPSWECCFPRSVKK